MQASQTIFGRRSQPHHFIVARGEKMRSVSLPTWAVWLGGAACVATVAWLIGSTAYIAFHDDIYAAAKTHRISVERAYEDRIAKLRRQIDEINTRQFLDQQAFEGRLENLLRKQADLEERHQQIADLFNDAKARKVTIDLSSGTGSQTADSRSPRGLLTTVANAAGFDPSRPAPLDPVRKKTAPAIDNDLPAVERIQASLDRVESIQGNMLDAIETTVGNLSEQLVEVSGAVGADLPETAAEEGVGGPLIELRRMTSSTVPDQQITRIRDELDRFDALRVHVSHLPVRKPLVGPIKYTSGFGTRLDPFLKRPALHTGLDFRASAGTPVHATARGVVTVASYSGGYGRLVEIDHGEGYVTRYGHMSRISVKVGDTVAAGEVVGLAGSSGRSTGPHLHYETRVNGRAKNPLPFVEAAQLLPEGF
jgi:murein DD-endopeptidase MepM/ murein hydrolase activator NlpD